MQNQIKIIKIIQEENKLYLVKIYNNGNKKKILIKDKYKEFLCLIFTAIECNVNI